MLDAEPTGLVGEAGLSLHPCLDPSVSLAGGSGASLPHGRLAPPLRNPSMSESISGDTPPAPPESSLPRQNGMSGGEVELRPFWWGRLDLNQRRLRQRIYSPPPLTTRALPRLTNNTHKAHQHAI